MTAMIRKTLPEAAAWLRQNDCYLLLTHRRPDGDTLGFAAALCRGLRQLGKAAWLLENPEVTPKYAPYLTGLTVPAPLEGATVLAIDTASPGLLPENAQPLADNVQLCIDHHGSNTGYAAATLVAPGCAACGEVIFRLLEALTVPVDKGIAEALYLAIATDTGCFRYSNVTAETMRIAAQLMDCGANSYPINKVMFETKRLPRLRLEAYLIEHVAFFSAGRIGISIIPAHLRQQLGLTSDDLEDISARAGTLKASRSAPRCASSRTAARSSPSAAVRPLTPAPSAQSWEVGGTKPPLALPFPCRRTMPRQRCSRQSMTFIHPCSPNKENYGQRNYHC